MKNCDVCENSLSFTNWEKYNDAIGRSTATPLIRGEKNYFPNGVLRSLNLHTPSMLRRPHFSRRLPSLTNLEDNEESEYPSDVRHSTSRRHNFQYFPNYQPNFDEVGRRRVSATAGHPMAKMSQLGPVVPRKNEREGRMKFYTNDEKWLNEDDAPSIVIDGGKR